MFSTFPYKAIKYQFSSDLPLITLTGIGFQNITDHSYSWHNLHRHDKHCLIQYCISGQGVLTINNSTYTITAGKAFLLNIPSNSHYYLPQNSTHWKFIYLEFSPEVLPLLCKIYNKLGPVISLANYPSLLTQIANFYTKALNNKLQSVFINTKLAYNFWIDLLKYNLAYDANNLTKNGNSNHRTDCLSNSGKCFALICRYNYDILTIFVRIISDIFCISTEIIRRYIGLWNLVFLNLRYQIFYNCIFYRFPDLICFRMIQHRTISGNYICITALHIFHFYI